jgi:ParB-like chromosome segregation protein Spo0J
MMKTSLQTIPLTHIRDSRYNPRYEPNADLDGLAASIGSQDAPTMVQPPILEQVSDQEYAVIAGERRILAARQAGWQSISCIVHPRLDPLQAHRLRLVENLHRKDLHPLDEATAIKIAWLTANAEALSLVDGARAILGQEASPAQTLTALQGLMETNGFSPNHPAVTWEALLAQLGLDLDAERRKKLLGVLRLDNTVQEQVRSLNVTEAALRAIGTLEPENQQRLVAEIAEDPALGRHAPRIARVVRDGSYSLDEALAEARGQAPGETHVEDPYPNHMDLELSPEHGNPQELLLDDRPMSAAMELLEIANRLCTALAALAEVCGGDLAKLPQPWGEYAREALDLIRSETSQYIQENKKGT